MKMDEKLERKLIETYEISVKNSNLISRWKKDRSIEAGIGEINSLDDVNKYLSNFLKGWKLKKEKVTKKGTIYTLLSMPQPGSLAMRNPDKYPDDYRYIKIQPKIRLSNKGDKK